MITVGVPIYNCDRQLITRCVNSILNQSEEDMEVLFVNDCCTDNTMQYVEEAIKLNSCGRKSRIINHDQNTGIAGSLNADINIGDIVLSTDACYHDVDITVFGYKKGEIPQIGAVEFKADAELREKAKASIKKAAPDIGVFEGRVCSGDQFISSSEVKDAIIKEHGGLCAEMEGAAIAQASYLNNTPFLIIRAISDKADGGAEVDYPTFEAKAAKDCAAIVMEIIAEL